MRGLLSISIVLVAACQLSSSARDGERCKADDDCASDYCYFGVCAGSDCTRSGRCEDGWSCEHVSGGIFTNPHERCFPLCGNCPLNYECEEPSARLCSQATTPMQIEITASAMMVQTGEPVTLTLVSASSPRGEITKHTWYFDGEEAGNGPDATYTFDRGGEHFCGIRVEDEYGVTDDKSLRIEVCGIAEARCTFSDECCESLGLYCAQGGFCRTL